MNPVKERSESAFLVFSEIEKSVRKENLADYKADLENLTLIISNGKEFDRKFSKKRQELVNQIKQAKHSKENLEYLKKELQILDKNKKRYEKIAKDFIQTIEDSVSPQEVDIYLSYLEEELTQLMGYPKNPNNPVYLKKLLHFLEEKRDQVKEAVESEHSLAMRSVKTMKETRFLKQFSVYIPDAFEGWSHNEISLEQLEVAIKTCLSRIEISTEEVFIAESSKKNLFFEKNDLLNTLISYAENSKLNFNRRIKMSNMLQIISSVFTIGSTVARACSFIPGVNLLAAVGTSRAFDFVAYSSLTVAHATDPNVSKEDKIAGLRHFESLKKYALAETVTGGIGTLVLVSGLAVGASAATVLAIPILAPVLLMVGSVTMMISNIISSVSSYKELKRSENILKAFSNKQALPNIKEKIKKGEILSKEENELLRAEYRVQTLKSQLKSRVANGVSVGLVSVLAAVVFFAAIGFPPLGVALISSFTAVAVVSALYATYQRHQETSIAKQTYLISQKIEAYKIKEVIKTVEVKPGLEEQPKVGLLRENYEKKFKKGLTHDFNRGELSREQRSPTTDLSVKHPSKPGPTNSKK